MFTIWSEFVRLIGAIVEMLLARWLLLSTWHYDSAWLLHMNKRLHWYRGFEYLHQVRGAALLRTV